VREVEEVKREVGRLRDGGRGKKIDKGR